VLGGAPLHVACDDPHVACTWTDHEDGTFTLSWEAQRCGSYLLSVAVDGVDVNGSPFPLIMLDPQHVIDALPVETNNANLSQLDVGWDEQEIEEGDRLEFSGMDGLGGVDGLQVANDDLNVDRAGEGLS